MPVDRTLMLLGLSSSVPMRSSESDLNSPTVPLRLISSPTATWFWIDVDVVKTLRPLETRASETFGPWI